MLLLSCIVACSLVASPARADDQRDTTIAHDYSRDVIIADLVTVASLGTLAPFSGPLIHLLHHRPATAVASFGLRVGGIALGAGSGALVAMALPPANFEGEGCFRCPPSPNYLPQMFQGMLVGAAVGWIVAVVFDAKFLAHQHATRPAITARGVGFAF